MGAHIDPLILQYQPIFPTMSNQGQHSSVASPLGDLAQDGQGEDCCALHRHAWAAM